MTPPDPHPVQTLIERAREHRRQEQPSPELFEATLGRLARAELTRERSHSFTRSHTWRGLPSLLRFGPARLGLALTLALAVLVAWRARRPTALDPHQDVPAVALAPEPPTPHADPRPALPPAPVAAPPPPASLPSPDEARPTSTESSSGEQKGAGSWTIKTWNQALRSHPPALRQTPDRRQCVEVPEHERLTLGSQGGPGRQGFPLVKGQRYRLVLPRLSVTGPVQLALTAFVASSEDGQKPPLVAQVLSTPSPSSFGFSFDARRTDARATIGLIVDAIGPSGASELCLGAPRIEALKEDDPEKTKPPSEGTRPPDESCNPPSFIDANGVKRLKSKCL